MILSVCIPIYNYDVRELVFALNNEIKVSHLDAEVILIDDASDDNYQKINEELQNEFVYIKQEKNIGRSAIRNYFLNVANGEFLLFLDCDSKIISRSFIRNYIGLILNNPDLQLVYGGFVSGNIYSKMRKLYTEKRETFSVEQRLLKPYETFKTINFLIKKNVFENVNFDEDIKNYGYEDFIFSQELKKKNIKVEHIDNPVSHQDIDTDEVFLEKTKVAIQTLANMSKISHFQEYLGKIKLYRAALIIKKMSLSRIYFILFPLEKIKQKLLLKPNVRTFDFYKLGLLLKAL